MFNVKPPHAGALAQKTFDRSNQPMRWDNNCRSTDAAKPSLASQMVTQAAFPPAAFEGSAQSRMRRIHQELPCRILIILSILIHSKQTAGGCCPARLNDQKSTSQAFMSPPVVSGSIPQTARQCISYAAQLHLQSREPLNHGWTAPVYPIQAS